MTGSTVNGSGKAARSGAHTLTLLAAPLNCEILFALEEGPKQQVDLRRECGMPAQTTLRAQLKKLEVAGAIDKKRRNRFPGVLEYELTSPGRDLLQVASSLGLWLRTSPEGEMELGGSAAKAAIKALVGGWSTCMLRALAARPLTLTELDGVISALNYPSLERRLAAMRLAGQVSAMETDGRGTPYGVSEWGRAAIAPIVSAVRWERRHMAEATAPITRVDVEAAFLMAVPLLRPSPELGGSCRMAVDLPSNGKAHGLCGVMVSVSEGRIDSCTTKLEGYPDAWASGSAAGWLAAVIDGEMEGLELGGDGALGRGLVEGLHRVLFGERAHYRP